MARRKRVTKRREKRRLSAHKRGYDKDWYELRTLFIRQNPNCCKCEKPGTDVDHIQSVADRPDLRLEWSNLRTLCKSCHSRRTVMDQGWHKDKNVIREEAAPDGMPTDPNHPWNQ